MKTKAIGYIFFICACCFFNAQAQNADLAKIENELLSHFKKIAGWRFSKVEGYYDSVESANKTFKHALNHFINKYPTIIKYSFKKLQDEGLIVATSPDKAFRIYSWDTWTGGTMHFFENIFQFRSNKNSQSISHNIIDKIGEDPKSYYYYIDQLKVENQTIYLTIDYSIYSGRDKASSIQFYKIQNGHLENANIIKTNSGLTNVITIYIDATLINENMAFPEFNYNATTKTIFVPLIYEDGKPSGKFIRYKFDGKLFKKVKKS